MSDKELPVTEGGDEVVIPDAECCGMHETCEKDSLLAAVSKDVEYYDDEELDRFRGIASDEFLPPEIEEFRYVLYTMREDEVENWAHCIETRGIELPHQIREEILMMLQ